MTPSLNYTPSAQIVSCELRGAYRFAWVQDAVVRQWIRCPMSLSCEAHRPPLWTADINLLRQRCGGVWLSSHTTTHISTRRHTQTRPYAYSLCNSRQRGCSVQSHAACATIKIWFFFAQDLHNTVQRQARRHRCRHKLSPPDVFTKYKGGLAPLGS